MSRSGWTNPGRYRALACLVVALCVPVSTARADGDAYPEARRFDSADFYRGLKRRGLTDLLALHLREHPPVNELAGLLLSRDIKLAEYADPSRTPAERQAAISEANRLLESLIERRGDDKETRGWRIELGRSLLYTEAERYTANILYRGGTARDFAGLAPLMDRASSVLGDLYASLSVRYDGLDDLSAAMYDRMESAGEIDRLERDMAMVDYLLAWARYYRAIARSGGDPARNLGLREVLDYLVDRSNLLDTPHATTHYQAQALLLGGMAQRQLGKHAEARRTLGRSIDVVAGVVSNKEREELEWVVTLARIELVRSFAEAGNHKAAKDAVEVFRRQTERGRGGQFGSRLIVALLERAVLRAEADALEAGARPDLARALRDRAVMGLVGIVQRDVSRREEIYSALYELLRDSSDVSSLSAFERCAVAAGALGEADGLTAKIARARLNGAATDHGDVVALEEQRTAVLDHATAVARSVLRLDPATSADLRAEAGFNLAVGLYRRGRRLDAAGGFLSVARDHPEFDRAYDAATFAVQLAWELRQDSGLGSRVEIQDLYLGALTTLTGRYAESDGARYWQFFLAQHLEHIERFEQAAAAYDQVSPDHERYAEATFLSAESLVQALRNAAAEDPTALQSVGSQATASIRAARNAREQLSRALASAGDPARQAELRHLAARADLLVGELCVIPGVDRFDRALESVSEFEKQHPEQSGMIGRVLRVRMIALEASGRVEEASQLIPHYVASDPEGAVPTLQGLFNALNEEIERDIAAGREKEAKQRAVSAVVLADGIYDVARTQPDSFGAPAVYALRVQLAEATLGAGDHGRANALFAECVAEDRKRYDDRRARDSRAIRGSAEAQYQLGRYEAALPLFNQVFRGAKRGDEIWWRSLLRDLQCRTQLDEAPHRIVKAIQQHKFFDREMGGRKLRREFDALLTANERRAERNPQD